MHNETTDNWNLEAFAVQAISYLWAHGRLFVDKPCIPHILFFEISPMVYIRETPVNTIF